MEFDSFSVGKTEDHTVVQDRVHVFDPKRVHWAVEYHPVLTVVLEPVRVLPDQFTGDSVRPALSNWVVISV
jgi:hypothetical protein